MKAYRIILYTLLAMIPAFVSCSDDTDDQKETPSGESKEVSFTLDREGIRLKVAGDRFEAGDAVGVYAVEGGSLKPSGNYADNKRFIFEGATFTADGTDNKIYFPQGNHLDFYIYYPYTETVTDATGMDFAVSGDRDMEKNDLMWAKASHNGGYSPVPLIFRRCNALIEGIFPAASLQILSARMLDVVTGGKLDLATGTYKELYPAKSNVTMQFSGNEKDAVSFRAILPPQKFKAFNPLFSLNGDHEEKILRLDRDEQLSPSTLNRFNFAPKYKLFIQVTPDDYTGAVMGEGTYQAGEIAVLSIEWPQPGYAFGGWYDQGGRCIANMDHLELPMIHDRWIEARFLKFYRCSISATDGGLFTCNSDNHPTNGYAVETIYDYDMDLEAQPEQGYRFIGWFEDNLLLTTDTFIHYTFRVGMDRYLTAEFEPE